MIKESPRIGMFKFYTYNILNVYIMEVHNIYLYTYTLYTLTPITQ